jgi:cytochrome P450
VLVLPLRDFGMDFIHDPWPTYAVLRDEQPAYYVEGVGVWLVTRYDTVAGATDPTVWSNAAGNIFPFDDPQRIGNTLGTTDPPVHTMARRLVMKAFTPRRVMAMEERARAYARELLTPLRDADSFDFVHDYAQPFTAAVVAMILGIPDEDIPALTAAIDKGFATDPSRPADERHAGRRLAFAYCRELLKERRVRPQDDVISGMALAEHLGATLTDEQIAVTSGTILGAGYGSTEHAISNLWVTLAENPDARAQIRTDPSLIPAAFEEAVRHEAAGHVFGRTLLQDVDVHGTTVPAGARVGLCYGSANRDERAFPAADRYDIHRDLATNRHLGFGISPHHCLGNALARLEAKITLEEALPLFGDFEVETRAENRLKILQFRGFTSLPTTVPGGRAAHAASTEGAA